ncbi:MAG: VCBS repeat-containing protein, partial [Planctomycetales bacterium]|nr:VCBS repeat-containing protein [Planctomycetales bacterium]
MSDCEKRLFKQTLVSKRLSAFGVFEALERRCMLSTLGFVPERVFQASSEMDSALVDVDRDGRSDIVQSFATQGDIRWLRNLGADVNGDEQFAAGETLLFVPGGFSAIAISDLNGDGNSDFIVARNTTNQIHLYETVAGDAFSFHERVVADHPTFQPSDLLIGDARADNIRQLFAVSDRGINLFESSAGGDFSLVDTLDAGIDSAVVGDVDGDQNSEIIYRANRESGFRNTVWLVANNAGKFGQPMQISAGSSGFQLADLDGDGSDELILSNSKEHALATYEYRDGAFELIATQGRYYRIFDSEAVDLDNDGSLELAIAVENQFIVLDATTLETEASFELPVSTPLHWSVDVAQIEFGLIDDDGLPDLLLWSNNTLSWYANEAGSFPIVRPFHENAKLTDAADFDGDSKLDLVFRRGDLLGVLFSTRQYAEAIALALPSRMFGVQKVADVDGDGTPDLLFTNGQGVSAARFDPEQMQFGPPKDLGNVEGIVYSFHVADMNSDQRPDLVTYSTIAMETDMVDVFYQTANGTFERKQTVLNAAGQLSSNGLGDVDGDEDQDFVSIGRWDKEYRLTTLVNDGGEFGQPIVRVLGNNSFSRERILAIVDANGDGKDEVLVSHSRAHEMSGPALLRFDLLTGEYTAQAVDIEISTVTRVEDFNGDGREDLEGWGDSGHYRLVGTKDGLDVKQFTRVGVQTSLGAKGPFSATFDADEDGADETFFSYGGGIVFAAPQYVPAGNPATQRPIWKADAPFSFRLFGDFDGNGTDDLALVGDAGTYVSFSGEDLQLWNRVDLSDVPALFLPNAVSIDV